MNAGDWWLCSTCQSLNDLSARRCYSCRQRKPKRPTRASERLGYRVVVSWDGKVRFEDKLLDAVKPGMPAQTPTRPPPLREPVERSILDVAPPPPHGARITYWLGDPARDPRWPAPPPLLLVPPVPYPLGPPPPLDGPPPGAPPRPMVALPVVAAPAPPPPRQTVGVPIVAVPPPPPLRPVVAVPIVAAVPSDSSGDDAAAPSWPHWRDLLDVPKPDATRLRQALEVSTSRSQTRIGGTSTPSWLSAPAVEATSRSGVSDPSDQAPWPEEDLTAKRADQGSG